MNILESLDQESIRLWEESGHDDLLEALGSDPEIRSAKVQAAVADDRGKTMFNAALHNAYVWSGYAERWSGDASEAAEAEFRQARWHNAAAWVAVNDPTLGTKVAEQHRKEALALLEKVCMAPVTPEGALGWRDALRAKVASSPDLAK